MSTINGAKHDVEDILASIRTSIADRSPGFDGEKRDGRITTLRGRSAIADEAAEFELPAIFKAEPQPSPGRSNLLGRLSEALASGQQERDRSRTVIPFEPLNGRMLEPPPVAEPVKDNSEAAATKIATENDAVKRNMPTFFDTRMSRLSAQPAPPAPVVEERKPQAPVRQVADDFLPYPPRLPDPMLPPRGAAEPGVEDAAAQLLRPILKQWLSENMPKIVEKALLNETGGDGRGGFPPRR